MSRSVQDWQQFILQEVGAAIGGNDNVEGIALDVITPIIGNLWDAWSNKAYYPHMQYLYVKRHALDILLGMARTKIDKTLGPVNKRLNQVFTNLNALRTNCDAELEILVKQARAERAPV